MLKSKVEMRLMPIGNLVTCSHEEDAENTARIWDPSSVSLVKAISTGDSEAKSLMVSPDDSILVGSSNGSIKIINPNNNESNDND